MFIDYYEILDIAFPSNEQEIKAAFRKQAKKWHPDINPDPAAHGRMVLIYEANLILSDSEAKTKYDIEYLRFKGFKERQKEQTKFEEQKREHSERQTKTDPFEYTYEASDETLRKWMSNAKRQAKEFVKISFEEALGMTKVGIKEGAKKTGQMFIGQIILGIVVTIIFALSKGCN